MGFLTTTDTHKQASPLQITDQALTDLMLSEYLNRIFQGQHGDHTLAWTQFFTTDADDLLYRREVLQELAESPALVESISAVCKCLSQIHALQEMPVSDEFYAESIREFSVLQLAHSTMLSLSQELAKLSANGGIRSRGLQELARVIDGKISANFTADFESQWQTYASGLEQLGSFRIRFTLDPELHVCGAALTAIQKEKFVKSSFNSHTLKEMRQPEKPWELTSLKEMKTPTEELVRVQLSNNQKQFQQALQRITADLDDLYQDLLFYLGALRYMRQMKKTETSLCYPRILPVESKEFSAKTMINPVLTVFKHGGTVPNDITFQPGGEILVLTGINQGGKTTFLRTVGVIQALFQLGWPVPATEAAISPVDRIVTVFSHEENTELQHGKLGQELKTIRAGLDLATPYSLLLCNEPITGTSPMENLFLSREVLTACKLQGYKGIWVTHIYDLASGAEEMNCSLSGSTISSIIAVAATSGEQVNASYRIERGNPQFTSYAKEVLRKETGIF
ncbi:MAG: hypothetical protein HFE64_08845 [Lachnospiraceae bacterium]|nr:hypothetical protein [Lachnospiraceae bacterium]